MRLAYMICVVIAIVSAVHHITMTDRILQYFDEEWMDKKKNEFLENPDLGEHSKITFMLFMLLLFNIFEWAATIGFLKINLWLFAAALGLVTWEYLTSLGLKKQGITLWESPKMIWTKRIINIILLGIYCYVFSII